MKRAIFLSLLLSACLPTSSSSVKTAGFGGGSSGGSTSSGGVTAHSSLTGLTTGDDHTQYQKESEKSAANGYASLNSSGYVPGAELGSGASIATKYLRGDNTWQTITSGSGDVVGPASSTDNAICRFDLATGKLLQNSGVLVDDSNNMSAVANLSNTGTTTFGDASGDSVTSNAASWTFANDTAVTLSGGVDGINFDANTMSIDATNNCVGFGTASCNTMAHPTMGISAAYSKPIYLGSGVGVDTWVVVGNGQALADRSYAMLGYDADGDKMCPGGGGFCLSVVQGGTGAVHQLGFANYASTGTINFYRNDSSVMASFNNTANSFTVNVDTVFGNNSSDTITSNSSAWNFANDTAVTLSGGVDGINFDANTLSIDATNNRVGFGTASPSTTVDIAGTLQCTGNATLGDASGDSVTSNAATWTFANDTAITLSGGVNGINFDNDTLSIDATNNSVGILDNTPDATLDVAGSFRCDSSAIIGDNVSVDTFTINALVTLASKTWASTDCDASGEVGRIVMHNNGANLISACVCQQTGASTYAFAAMGGGTCP